MKKEEWARRFTAKLQEHCNLSKEMLADIVEANWACRVEQGDTDDPEDAAMDELTCWLDEDEMLPQP